MNFAEFMHQQRTGLGYTLRRFCQTKGFDAAYISRLENGLITPPEDAGKVKALAIALELEEGSPDWVRFFDAAATSRGKMPEDIVASMPETIHFLPAFCRRLNNDKLTEEDAKELIQLLRGEKPENEPK